MRVYGRPTIFWNGSGTANANSGNDGGGSGGSGNGGNSAGATSNGDTAGTSGAATNANGVAGANTAAASGSEGTAGADTVESLRARLSAVEAENATYKSDKSDAESRRQASLTAEQQAVERATKAEGALLAAEVRLAANEAGAIDAETVRLLIDPAKIQRDANGNATNISELVTAVLEAKPFLKAPAASTQQGGPNPPTVPQQRTTNGGLQNSGQQQTFTTSQIRDPQFYKSNEAAILKAANEGRILEG